VVSVKVKTRMSDACGAPERVVSPRMQSRMIKAGLEYIKYKKLHQVPCWFYVVAINSTSGEDIVFIRKVFEMALIDNFSRSDHAMANTDIALLVTTKTGLDNVLIMGRELEYKLLWVFSKTLSKRLRETNEKMAGFLTISREC
jgi:hypothetical protein